MNYLYYREFYLSSHNNLRQALDEAIEELKIPSSVLENLLLLPLQGGFTSSQVYQFQVESKSYVLKVLDPKRIATPEIKKENRYNELVAHKKASDLKISPRYIFSDSKALILLMDYIEGESLKRKDLEQPCIVKQLATSLRLFHQSELELPYQKSIYSRAKKHYERGKTKGVALPSGFKGEYKEFILRENEGVVDEVPCHADLHLSNIMLSRGKLYFIDWATATLDDPYRDLAYTALLAAMTAEQVQIFLSTYYGRKVRNADYERLNKAQLYHCLLTAIIWFDFSESEGDKELAIENRETRLNQLLERNDLKSAISYLQDEESVNPAGGETEKIKLYALAFYKEYLRRKSQLLA
ncbi:MAG: phosphotransferase [Chlamydiales bacterium]|nr:phosphotransferase [Chlamydiales bacterium]